MKKAKRRLSFLDVGGIPVQPSPQEQTPVVDPNAERLERLRQNFVRIHAENAQAAVAAEQARATRIEAVRLKCRLGEWERVEELVRTMGYRAEETQSGQAYEFAFGVVIGER